MRRLVSSRHSMGFAPQACPFRGDQARHRQRAALAVGQGTEHT
jgi:hypothetical protein